MAKGDRAISVKEALDTKMLGGKTPDKGKNGKFLNLIKRQKL